MLLDQLSANRAGNALKRQLLRLQVLFGAHNHNGLRVQLQRVAVGAFFQDFRAEGSLDDRAVGRQAFTAFTTEWRSGLNLEAQVLCRLSQIRGFKRRIFQLLGHFDKLLLDQLRFQIVAELFFQTGKGRHRRCFDAQQLDQMPAEVCTHGLRNLVLVQGIQRLFKSRVVDALACKPKITALAGRTRVLRELFGQRRKTLTLCQTLLNFFNLCLGLLVVQLVVHFDEDVCSTTLFRQVGDFFLIGRLQVIVLDRHLVEERRFLQFDVIKHNLLRAHELLGMLVVVSFDFVVGHFDRRRIGRQRQRSEIARLFFQTGKSVNLCVGHEGTSRDTRTHLTDEHFLTQHLAKLHAAVTELTNHLVESVSTELAINLKLRRLQQLLIQCGVGKREPGIACALQQQLAIDQAFKGRFTQQFFVEHRRIEILAQLLRELLSQLAALHVHCLTQLILSDVLAVDLSCVLFVAGCGKHCLDAGEGHQSDDDSDNCLGNPAL
ncbi:hypothetical protein ALP75_202302 [Pseudomonas syringae pv. actinidiae]|nr:hypothetical protein ALP75_202302 [Pseudomonas syringae pv. actinidiae]